LAITANQPFSSWDQVFPEVAMTLAAVDRLVHHSTIFELNVDSYRRHVAKSGQSVANGKSLQRPD
jgi:DNA replication protein DnaC